MNLRRRFGLFGVGFAAGIVIVLFVLNGKNASCNYFPNARMLEILRNKERVYSNEVLNLLKIEHIDSMEVVKILSDGDIDFSKSKVRQEPCRYYWIDGFLKEKNASIYVQNCDTLITIQKLYLNQ